MTTAVEAFFTVVKDQMVAGNNIYVRGFGSFVNKKKRARKVARNISQNTSLIIEEALHSYRQAVENLRG